MTNEVDETVDASPTPDTSSTPPAHARRRSATSVVLGIIGELLLTIGILIGLFIIWQVWWTSVLARAHAAEVIDDLGFSHSDVTLDDSALRAAGAPMPEGVPDGVWGVLYLPTLDGTHAIPIAEGTTSRTLDAGYAGHYEGTAQVGQIGNFSLAAHRLAFGDAFMYLDRLNPGDPIIIETRDTWYVYTMSEQEIVQPSQVEVIAPVPGSPGEEPTEAMITLTTCHPLWNNYERLIVHGTLQYWAPTSDGVPAEFEVN